MGVPELESNCNALGNLFQGLINDMRDSVPVFEDLVSRATKLHSALRASNAAAAGFLEAFQKVADAATGSKGATKEIGKSLTRLCLRHRSIESKMKIYTNSLLEELAVPLQEKLEEWKRNTVQIDKDHAKDNKRVRADIKRASSDTIRLQKKTRKGKGDAREKLESAMLGVTDKYTTLEEVEKLYVRKALTEERKHFCEYICCLRPVMDSEMSMVNEIAHLQEIVDHLSSLAADPDTLPEASEQVISDIKGTNYTFKAKTPPDSPTSDRHSLSSSMNSLVSAPESDGASQRSSSPCNRLQALKSSSNNGLLSVASQDSGFTSQDALFARPAPTSLSNQNSSNKQRSHGSLEEEKSDSVSVYSSVSQGSRGSHDFDSHSVHSGSAHSVPAAALQAQLRHQPALDRAHTIGGGRPQGRPHLGSDTYDGPLTNRSLSSELGSMGPPPRPQRMSSYDSSSSSTSGQSLNRSGGSGTSNRNSMPARTRAKPKPVAMPSIPFMDTEPIYMNTQELAAKIAARRRETEGEPSSTETATTAAVPSGMINTTRPPTTKDEEIKEIRSRRYSTGSNIAAAVKEMEASTAALQSLTDNDILVRKAQNDALADAIKELEASTAALNDCLDDEPCKRQSIVSSSGYGTTTSNSSASEEVQLITHDGVENSSNHNSHIQHVNISNRISEETRNRPRSQTVNSSHTQPQLMTNNNSKQNRKSSPPIQQQHRQQLQQQQQTGSGESEGVEVSNWAGKAILRRHAGQSKPPPPVRRSSSVTSTMNGALDRQQSQRVSKPPVISPKPKITSPPASSSEGGVSERTSSSSVSSDMFPSPPPPTAPGHHDDEDPYAVPGPCHPIDCSLLPPPPPEFGTDIGAVTDHTDCKSLLFNISELPPPLPDSPAPAYLTSQLSPNPPHSPIKSGGALSDVPYKNTNTEHLPSNIPQITTNSTTRQHSTKGAHHQSNAPWEQGGAKSPNSNSKGEAPLNAPWEQGSAKSPKSNSKGEAPPPILAKKGKKINSNFLAQLNSTLGGADKSNGAPIPNSNRPPNAALENIKHSRSKDSPPRDNLLSQIHGGVRLKKAASVSDRSAPSL